MAQRCPDCNQKMKKSIFGNRKGYRVVSKGKKGGRIQCESCGARFVVDNSGEIHGRA